MPVLPTLGRLARWLSPSVVAACAGTVVAGVFEGLGMDGVAGIAGTAGFFALLALPALFAACVLVRALWLAWQPRSLGLVDADGAAPRLAGWLAVVWLAALGFAWVIYKATWWLAEETAFRPLGVGFALPVFAMLAGIVALAASRPGARLFAELARRGDARWRRAGRPTLLRPRTLLVGAAALALATAFAIWRFAIKPRIGPLDTSVLFTPLLATTVTAAMHAVRLGRARLAIAALGVATLATAFVVRHTRPSLTLEIWGDRPLAGLAIDKLFELEAIRDDIPLAELAPVAVQGAPHPDIILVTIDTVRADRTPPYGGPAIMPTLKGLGERGAVFTWAFAPSNVTRRSIPALVTGLAPNRVRGRVVGWALRVDPRHVLLAERLRAGGYATAGFMCCEGFWGEETKTGLARGLEHLEIDDPDRPNGTRFVKQASRWLRARTDKRPLFLWMHVIEPHNWTQGVGTPRNDEDRKRFYDRSLAISDGILRELLSPFAGKDPLVIVTADHGEALGEHGHDYHSTDLYNSQMRVPLVIAGPGISVRAIPETVSLVDLVPTILDLAGFEPPKLDGRSLADVIRGTRTSQPDTGTAFAAMIKDRSNPGGITSVVKGRWKLIANDDGLEELYDIYADPNETRNLAEQNPVILNELRLLLASFDAAGQESPFQ